MSFLPSKSLFTSKTFWFNALHGAAAIADRVAGTHLVGADGHVAISSIGNVLLRLLTKQPVHVVD